MSQDYIYAVARIRSKEMGLLTRQDMEQLLACRSAEECLRTLRDKGWQGGEGENATAEEMLLSEEARTWALIHELVEDLSPFDVLLVPTDYNNLKAAIKCVVTDTPPRDVFLPGGKLDPEALLQCARESDFSSLPEAMAAAGDEAHHTLLQTGDGQLCDLILDKACLEEIHRAGTASEDEVPRRYAELLVATSDIKIAVRACKTKKDRAFLDKALAACDSLDVEELAKAACGTLEDLFEYLRHTPYADAAEALKESYSAFEKWCDDTVMDLIRDQKTNPFTVGPLFAYVLARRSEIASVRIILSGKINELAEEVIRQRVRDTYV